MTPALLCAFGCLSVLAATADLGNPMQDAERPHADRKDRAWKRFRNAELSYCVSYPSRWSKGDAFDGSGLLIRTGVRQMPNSTGEIDVGPIDLLVPDIARLRHISIDTDSLDNDLAEHLAGLKKFVRAERLEVLSQHRLKLQGSAALYAKNRYYDPLERRDWIEEVVFVRRAGLGRTGGLYRLELQCPPAQIDRFENVFAYLVNSFAFDCK